MFGKADQIAQSLRSLLFITGAGALAAGLAAPASARGDDRSIWTAAVTRSLQQQVRVIDAVPASVRASKAAIVGAHFNADGTLRSASLDRSTGIAVLDAEALRAVGKTDFPVLPASMRGKARMVPVEVFFSAPGANPGRAAIRDEALSLSAGARRYYATVPAGRPTS